MTSSLDQTWPDDSLAAEYLDILRLTGEVTVAWSAVESYLSGVLVALAGCEYSAGIVIYYSPSSFSGRLSIIRNLINHEMPRGPERHLLERVCGRLERLSKARNAFVHSSVFVGSSPGNRPQLNRRVMHPSKAEIGSEFKATANDIQHHVDRLRGVYQLLHLLLNGSDVSAVRAAELAAFSTTSASSSSE